MGLLCVGLTPPRFVGPKAQFWKLCCMSHYLSHGTDIRVDIVGEGAKEQESERGILVNGIWYYGCTFQEVHTMEPTDQPYLCHGWLVWPIAVAFCGCLSSVVSTASVMRLGSAREFRGHDRRY
ncbi:hypothetical protein AFLA_008049 [Aspergillus flavus NRRL3357]|nr:hypothetical protein AFLA_008049 [Aspergillus flavus NRRL3357]